MVENASEERSQEEALARQSQASRAALERYFARHGVPPSECDDCVQEVFLRIVRRGRSDELEQFSAYIFATAASVLTDRHRARRTREADRHVPFEPELHGGHEAGPDQVLADREKLRRTTQVLMELPERTRHVFILRRLERLPHGEIAVRLGLSVSAVEKHMLRATRHLLARTGGHP